jgi:homoserine kinase type II
MQDAVARQVIGAFGAPYEPLVLRNLGSAGGFSGARFWRVATRQGEFCLRCWPPEHPSRERLEFTHRALQAAAGAGLQYIPAPIAQAQGETIVECQGRLWELSPWLPGVADFHNDPSRARLSAALQALARLHDVCAGMTPRRLGAAPSMQERCERLQYLLATGVPRLSSALHEGDWPELAARGRQIVTWFSQLAPECVPRAARAMGWAVPLFPTVRDIWHDHVLFVGDAVTGIVDFGAMRTDSAAIDIARLLGSMVDDDADAWRWGLDAYCCIRSLSARETELIRVADESNVLLSGMNWLSWVYLEQRSFADRRAVQARLDNILARLQELHRRHGSGETLFAG